MKLKAEEYKQRGWVEIYSKPMNKTFYLVRNTSVEVPDKTLLRVTQRSLPTLEGLKPHETKELFQAADILCSNVYDAEFKTTGKQRKQKRVDRTRKPLRKGVRETAQEAWC